MNITKQIMEMKFETNEGGKTNKQKIKNKNNSKTETEMTIIHTGNNNE